jgi:hypothetical protein
MLPISSITIKPSRYFTQLTREEFVIWAHGAVGLARTGRPCYSVDDVNNEVDRLMFNSESTKISLTEKRAKEMAEYVGYDDVSP